MPQMPKNAGREAHVESCPICLRSIIWYERRPKTNGAFARPTSHKPRFRRCHECVAWYFKLVRKQRRRVA